MAVCCFVPLALVVLSSVGGIGLGKDDRTRSLSLVMSLLCPVSMIVMMYFMDKQHKHKNKANAEEPLCHSFSDTVINITDDPDRTKELKQ